MKKILSRFIGVFSMMALYSLFLTVPAYAASCKAGAGASFLKLFPTWYEYLELNASTCEIEKFDVPGDIWKIALAAIAILLRVAGIVAVAFTIMGGFKYVLSRGNPTEAAKARQTIIDALIGLAIASIAIVLVAFLGRKLTQ